METKSIRGVGKYKYGTYSSYRVVIVAQNRNPVVRILNVGHVREDARSGARLRDAQLRE